MVLSHSRPSYFMQDAEKDRQHRSRIDQILNVPQRVRLRSSSLAAALLDNLFEHPAADVSLVRRFFRFESPFQRAGKGAVD